MFGTCYAYKNLLEKTHDNCEICKRISVESKITLKVIKTLLSAGYTLDMNDGEETTVTGSVSANEVHCAMSTTDEDLLIAHKEGEKSAWVSFIYGNGNGGWDVISDYTLNLEEVLKPVTEYCNR